MNSVVDKMDPPLINESSFSAANPASYSLAEIWPFSGEPGGSGGGLGLRMGNLGQSLGGPGDCSVNRDGSLEESTVTEQSGGGGGGGGGGRKRRDVSSEDESSKQVSTSSGNGLVPHPSRASLGPTGTSPSRFAPIGQQGHPANLPTVSASGTNYMASSPSPAASGGTSAFKDARLPSPWN
ncbi:transcription factor bHLH79-like isoform X2 [Pyrus x bretschneideri]|uniref:transcription factor bHLH79-like isoform X2 n=1 Tax=Pyrus x bretschneideri TaxID=225117 RepID=UPI000510C478|nr:transcription factor bHLH79-like isoform X2 [Pyrus x bretschneideri]